MVAWSEQTFEKLVAADPEPLTSRFKVTHAMILDVIERPGDPFAAMRHLLTDNHEDRAPSGGTSARPSRSTVRCWPAAWWSGWTSRTTRAVMCG